MKIAAVAFDLDGTLYSDIRLFIRLVPFFLKHHGLLLAMGKTRKQLRDINSDGNQQNHAFSGMDFYDAQAALIAEILQKSQAEVKEKIEKLIYRGWEKHFKKIRLFPYVKTCLEAFRQRGVKIGLLSDFPPEKKLENLGIMDYWDSIASSEESGRLKPDPLPFLALAGKMKLPPEEILYVGNNYHYDVLGARSAGMKTALICSRWTRFSREPMPDFIFHDYRQLQKYVLGCINGTF